MSKLNETIKEMFKPFTATASTSGFTHNEVYAVLLNTLDELKQARQHEFKLIERKGENFMLYRSEEELKVDIKIAKMRTDYLESQKNNELFLLNQIIRSL